MIIVPIDSPTNNGRDALNNNNVPKYMKALNNIHFKHKFDNAAKKPSNIIQFLKNRVKFLA